MTDEEQDDDEEDEEAEKDVKDQVCFCILINFKTRVECYQRLCALNSSQPLKHRKCIY